MGVPTRRVFANAVTGLFEKAFGSRVGPELRAKLKAHGLDLAKVPPTIDATVFASCFAELREALFPNRLPEDAAREMGRTFLDAYFSTPMGAMQRMVLRFLPTETVVERAPDVAASGTNYIRPVVERVGERHYTIRLNDYSSEPGFLAGIIERGIVLSRAREPEVRLTLLPERAVLYDVTWKA